MEIHAFLATMDGDPPDEWFDRQKLGLNRDKTGPTLKA
jgi:hypothetical protein